MPPAVKALECEAMRKRCRAVDEPTGAVVELESSVLAKFHDAGGGEALRMRGDAKAMARHQCFGGREISRAVGALEGGLVAVHDNGDTAREP